MSVAVTLRELLVWSEEASAFWKAHLEANPALLDLPCGINGAADVREFVRHIWSTELRWSHRLAGLPEITREDVPSGPVDAMYQAHRKAAEILRKLLDLPSRSWEEIYELNIAALPPEARRLSRRKVAIHALLHSQRHWAQLATLVRSAGFPSGFRGDFLFSAALA